MLQNVWQDVRYGFRGLVNYLVVGPFAIVLAFPFYFALVTMFKTDLDLANVEHSPYLYNDLEGNFHWDFWNYATTKEVTFLFTDTNYPRWLWNTLLVGLAVVAITLLVAELVASGKPVIVAAVRDPYDIAYLPSAETYLATYSYAGVSVRALAKTLFGEMNPSGRLPVDIPAAGDPGTVLFTGSFAQNMTCSGAWLAHHEYMVEDVNKLPLFLPAISNLPFCAVVPHLFGETAFQEVPWPMAAVVTSACFARSSRPSFTASIAA